MSSAQADQCPANRSPSSRVPLLCCLEEGSPVELVPRQLAAASCLLRLSSLQLVVVNRGIGRSPSAGPRPATVDVTLQMTAAQCWGKTHFSCALSQPSGMFLPPHGHVSAAILSGNRGSWCREHQSGPSARVSKPGARAWASAGSSETLDSWDPSHSALHRG